MSERVERQADGDDPLVSAVLETVDEPAAVCGPGGRLRGWNGAFADRLGAVGDLGEASLGDLVDCPSEPLARAVETGERTMGTDSVSADGDAVTVAVRPVERDGSTTALVTTVTRRDDPLEDDRALYEASVDAAADTVYVIDREYTIRMAGSGFRRTTDVPTEEIEGRDVDYLRELGLVDRDRFQEGVRSLRRLFDGEAESERVTLEATFRGQTRVMENHLSTIRRDGEVVAVVNVVHDVTERERRREQLAANRERLTSILDNLPVMLVVVDDDGRVDHCQGVDFDEFDCDRSDFVGAPIERFEGVCPEVVAGFQRALDGETTTATETISDRTYDARFEPLSTDGDGDSDGTANGAIATAMDVTDRTERERALETREEELRAVIESCADPIAMQDLDGRYRVVNDAMVATLDVDREAVIGSHPEDVFPDAFTRRVDAHRQEVLETERARVVEERVEFDEHEAVVQLTVAPYRGPDRDVQGTVSIARDITELERQRDELETLTEIQELVQESMRALAGATTAEAIRETVCDRLAESAFYEFAWIGRLELGERKLEPKYSAGDGEEYLDAVAVRVDASDHGGGPESEAYRTGEVQVVHDVASDPDFEPWREAALESGFQSVAAVPLTHGSTTHGLLAVYADRPDAFSESELAGFETLGEVVGFALSAAQYRRLLEADSVLQLEFEIRGETPLLEASSEHGCRFEIERAVQTGDDRVVSHLTVEGADPVVGEMAARELPNLQQLRRLDGKDGPHYEMAVSDSVFQYLAEAGAYGERGVVEDGVGHMHVEAPADADVRQIVDTVSERFPTVNFVAKREERRTETPWWHTHDDIGAQLTDRQRAVLKTAYFNGYYEWPRETDSEALADSLDIASTTLLQHLRKGHRRVLEAMFES